MNTPAASVDLYWIPLGAGGQFVRINGKVYEAVQSAIERRPQFDLYHAALALCLPDGRLAIECAWTSNANAHERGVVAAGPVGSTWAGYLPIFRYEVRCWLDGVIPDIAEAVESPQRLTTDLQEARRLYDLAPAVPTPAWGRDELKVGEMWNSNSVVSWLLSSSGIGVESVRLPENGRAPGWDDGVAVAQRDAQ